MSGGRPTARVGVAFLLAALVAGCGADTTSPTPAPPASTGADLLPRLPAVLDLVADSPKLHGSAVGRPRVVALPDGSFLMLRAEDTPAGGALLRSDDGRQWDELNARESGLDAAGIIALAANETAAVIVGTTEPRTGTGAEPPDEALWTSADGVAWTRAPAAGRLPTFGPRDIVGSPRGFAAVGDAQLTIFMSGPDGRQWRPTEVVLGPGTRGAVEQVAAGGDGFLAVGAVDGRAAAWRWDGARWVRLPFAAAATLLNICTNEERMILTGVVEMDDPLNPGQTKVGAVAWQSIDGGMTWIDIGLSLDGIATIGAFASGVGFLAVLEPNDRRNPRTAWRSTGRGSWEPASLEKAGPAFDPPFPASLAVSGRRVVVAGNNVGTGGGGDRIAVWTGDTTAP